MADDDPELVSLGAAQLPGSVAVDRPVIPGHERHRLRARPDPGPALPLSRASRITIGLLAASTLGPYIVGGIRTDQIVTYGAGVVVLLTFAWDRISWTRYTALIVGLWLSYLGVAAAGATGGAVLNTSPWGVGSALANLDNLTLPLTAFLIGLIVASGCDRAALSDFVAKAVALVAAANAMVAIANFLKPGLMGPLLVHFQGSGGTAERALTLGRFSGVVGQPSVAGVLYSLGLLSAIYGFRHATPVLVPVVAFIVIGGLLSISKGFLLVGLPVTVWLLIRSQGRRLAIVLVAIVVYQAAVSLNLINGWRGWQRVVRLLPGHGAGLSLYSGNRYGANSSTAPLVRAVTQDHPVFGYGLRGLATATDTAFVQALVLAGVVGVVCLAVTLVVMWLGYWAERRGLDTSLRRFYFSVLLVVTVVSFGTPALTANRVSVLVWLLVAVILGSSVKGRPLSRRR